jgi:hypothetical protein
MTDEQPENPVTVENLIAPFTGFLAVRLATELLPWLDKASPAIAPFFSIVTALAMPMAWSYLIIFLLVNLSRYTYHYYQPFPAVKHPAHDTAASWYVEEDFLNEDEDAPPPEDLSDSPVRKSPALVNALRLAARLTFPLWAMINVISICYIAISIIVLMHTALGTGVGIDFDSVLHIFVSGCLPLGLSTMIIGESQLNMKEKISRARSALRHDEPMLSPPDSAYRLSDETPDAAARKVTRDWATTTDRRDEIRAGN